MKQIIQDLKNGDIILKEVPVSLVKLGSVPIKTAQSPVLLGTERMLVKFGKANFLPKAKQQPDKVKMVLDKVKTDGLKPTMNVVLNKLNQPLPLVYCNVGEVVSEGKGVSEFSVGDRAASNKNHADYVCGPKNLLAKILDNISDEEAILLLLNRLNRANGLR